MCQPFQVEINVFSDTPKMTWTDWPWVITFQGHDVSARLYLIVPETDFYKPKIAR